MDHLAVMTPSWKMIDKILTGEKTIESRWSQQRRAPWGRVSPEDRIFFAESSLIRASARVASIIEREITSDAERRTILNRYASSLGVDTEHFYPNIQNSRYVTLILIKEVKKEEPKRFSKSKFGPRATWISISNISSLIL